MGSPVECRLRLMTPAEALCGRSLAVGKDLAIFSSTSSIRARPQRFLRLRLPCEMA
jgi:hypothetical protein